MPTSSEFSIRPQGADRLLFEGAEYRYVYVHTLLEHQDHDPMVIAQRRPMRGKGPARLVVLKRVVMPLGEERRQRALEEVELAAWLRHPGIARVFALEEHQGRPYVVTEYVPGCFLETAVEAALLQRKALSPAFACYVAAEVADALHYAWHCEREGGQPLHVVHRAISPMHIRLGLKGKVKLTNFGVASSRMARRLLTPPKVVRADLAYASPEVVRFQVLDGRADLYSLGMVLLEMLSGQYPLDPPDVNPPSGEPPEASRYTALVRCERTSWTHIGELAHRIQRFGPEDVERVARDVPKSLKRIVHKALRGNPEDRYQTGADLRDELRAWLLSQGKPFGPKEAARELASLVSKQSPHETRAFPSEQGVLLTPEQAQSTKERLH